MFIATVLRGKLESHRQLDVSDGRFAHAAVLSAIQKIRSDVAKTLHDITRDKPFSCALLPQVRREVRIRLVFHSTAGVELHRLLCEALNREPVLFSGTTKLAVTDVETIPTEWSGVATWADLLHGSLSRWITLRFLTPTAIMKTDGPGMRYSALYPEPFDVFSGLERRWSALQGPTLIANLGDRLRDAGCVISGYDLKTHTFATKERTQIGYTGEVHYELRNTEPEFVQAVCALARLAHFTGVGYQTARGMGLVSARIGK